MGCGGLSLSDGGVGAAGLTPGNIRGPSVLILIIWTPSRSCVREERNVNDG